MQNFSAPAGRPARLNPVLGAVLLLALLLLAAAARAQTGPPTWAGAATGSATQLPPGTSQTRATAVDPATGNVYSTGFFSGTVVFGSTSLTSAGGNDLFVAKWDAATGAYTSVVRGGGTSADQGLGIALSSAVGTTSVYVTGFFNSAAATNVSIAGNGAKVTLNGTCKAIVLAGNSATVTGSAGSVSVAGNENTATLDTVDSLSVTGNKNKITYAKASDAKKKTRVSNLGNDNTVTKN